ncbi:hypothetical protein J6590_080632 [Homalodisca vitripennis]|nr:hypothetical protein J6590_080632 [Homalodisca vitripennis]
MILNKFIYADTANSSQVDGCDSSEPLTGLTHVWRKLNQFLARYRYKFQENLLKTMLQIENTFFELGESCSRDCLIICDRGAMDASAFISRDKWERMMSANGWNSVELRDNRYNQIVHILNTLCYVSVKSWDKWERMMSANGWNSVELRDNRYNQIVHILNTLCYVSVKSRDKWERMMSANSWNSVELQDNRYNQIVHLLNTLCYVLVISRDKWERMMSANGWNSVELRDNRYNQIVHLVSAANGAEDFYSTEDHACRSETVVLARELDYNAAAAWVGHPYFDVIDNSTDFETKICRMIASVCQKLGIDTGDRLTTNSRKRKFLVRGPLPDDSVFPPFQDFDVVHNYLQTSTPSMQARLRKRGQKGTNKPNNILVATS